MAGDVRTRWNPTVSPPTEAIDPRYRALVLVAAYGGLRFGEAAGLRKRDITLRKIKVAGSIVEVNSKAERVDRAKTPASIREVSIPESVMKELARHLVEYPVTDPDGLVFTAPGGGALSLHAFRNRTWITACEGAGLEPVRFHDLRHTGVALAIKAGAHPRTI